MEQAPIHELKTQLVNSYNTITLMNSRSQLIKDQSPATQKNRLTLKLNEGHTL